MKKDIFRILTVTAAAGALIFSSVPAMAAAPVGQNAMEATQAELQALAVKPQVQSVRKKKPKLSRTKVTLRVKKTTRLRIRNVKAKKVKKLRWKSKNKRIAVVSRKGKIRAKKKGKTTIIATFRYQKKKYTLKCRVTVKKAVRKKTSAGTNTQAPVEKPPQPKILKYSYEIKPMLAPFNEYFFIKTNNPDPASFRFLDTDSKYVDKDSASDDSGAITPVTKRFADVKYDSADSLRVNGGYIAWGGDTDGGKVVLQEGTPEGSSYNVSTGSLEKYYTYKTVDKTAAIPEVVDEADYLIQHYRGTSGDFFDQMDSIQTGFDSVCLYSGAYVLGELKKQEGVHYGISSSPHVDQDFYIQSPYYRADSKPMLVSGLYPFRHDSLGFPSMMGKIAKRLQPAATWEWSSDYHYEINVTYNGKTSTYGGAGQGGGQGILPDQVKYWFRLDGSADDAYQNATMENLAAWNREYGALDVPDQENDPEKFTWKDVSKAAGEGAYARIALITSVFFSNNEAGYTYFYDRGGSMPGYFSNVWYDGRYFNRWEYIYLARYRDDPASFSFEETVKNNEQKPGLVFKDMKLQLPQDGSEYRYGYYKPEDKGYDPATGIWKGYTKFSYDEKSGNWIADKFTDLKVKEKNDDGSYSWKQVDDPAYKEACTLTMDQIKSMNVDRNKDKLPEKFLIYDMTTTPGTPGTNNE